MSEADRVFPARKRQETKTHTAEKRFILSPSRRGGPAGGKGRVVEVVHVRRDGAKPAQARPRPAPWSVRAETWPEGVCAKTPSPPPPPTTRAGPAGASVTDRTRNACVGAAVVEVRAAGDHGPRAAGRDGAPERRRPRTSGAKATESSSAALR